MGTATTAHSAWFTYEFNGEGIILGGYTPGDAAAPDGLGTYALDDGPPIAFEIPATTVTKMNHPYFSITNMKPGPHRLEVINKGNESTTPLAFSYIYTKNSPNPPTPTIKPKNTSKIIAGAVGGGVGAVILAALLIFIIIRIRRRRRRAHLIITPSILATEASMATHNIVSTDSSGPQSASTLRGDSHADFQTGTPAEYRHTSQSVLRHSFSTQPSSLPFPRSRSPPPAYAAVPAHPPLTFYAGRNPTTVANNSSLPGALAQSSQGRAPGSAVQDMTSRMSSMKAGFIIRGL